jgi:hypothetical protein
MLPGFALCNLHSSFFVRPAATAHVETVLKQGVAVQWGLHGYGLALTMRLATPVVLVPVRFQHGDLSRATTLLHGRGVGLFLSANEPCPCRPIVGADFVSVPVRSQTVLCASVLRCEDCGATTLHLLRWRTVIMPSDCMATAKNRSLAAGSGVGPPRRFANAEPRMMNPELKWH